MGTCLKNWLNSRPFAAPVAASGTGVCKVRLFTGHERTPPEYQVGSVSFAVYETLHHRLCSTWAQEVFHMS